MSLPKRDGVHDRYYLIHKPDTSPEVLAEADLCIQDVLNGTARENHSAYPTVVRNHNGTPFLPDQLLERYLTGLPLKGFPCEDAVSLCDAMRRLVRWQEIRYTLEKYIEKQVQERFFLVGERDDDFTVFPPCTVWPELRPEDVDEGLLRFACYVAVCHTVYGQSFESLTTEHILGLVSQLRPDMVKQLKTAGSGKLPKDIQQRKTEHFTASANDAFAAIRITAKDSTEECYSYAKRESVKEGFVPVLIKADDETLWECLIMNSDPDSDGEDDYAFDPDKVADYRKKILSAPVKDSKAVLEALIGQRKEEAEDDDMDWDEEILGEMEGGEPNDRFSSYWDDDTEMTYPLILAKIPVKNPWEIFAYLPFGNWNECPNTPELMAAAKYWFEQYGAVPAAMSHDELEFLLPAPVPKEKAMDTAVELYGFCPDLDQNEDGSIGSLADALWQSTVWYFWWD